MAFRRGSMSRKARILLVCGTFCLALAGGSAEFYRPTDATASAWFDGVRGLLLGVAIGLNFSAVLVGKGSCRSRTNSAEGA
jgi:hypothetical protein